MARFDEIMAYLNGQRPRSAGIRVGSGGPGPDDVHGSGPEFVDTGGNPDPRTNPWREKIARQRALWGAYSGMGSAGNEFAAAGIPIEVGQRLIQMAKRGHLDELLGRLNAGARPGWVRPYIRAGSETGNPLIGGAGVTGALGYLDDRFGQLRDLRTARNDARGGDPAQFMQALEAFKQYRQQLRQAERKGLTIEGVR